MEDDLKKKRLFCGIQVEICNFEAFTLGLVNLVIFINDAIYYSGKFVQYLPHVLVFCTSIAVEAVHIFPPSGNTMCTTWDTDRSTDLLF